jgi:Tfp pilus assembly protein PilN
MTSTEPVLLPSEVWSLILQFKSDALHAVATKIQAVARGYRPREKWVFFLRMVGWPAPSLVAIC